MTKLPDEEHEDDTTKMSKPDELQGKAPKLNFTTIPLCDIDNAESTTTLSEDVAATTMSTEPLNEYPLEAIDKVVSNDDASIFGGKSEMV
ncbi:gag-pol polyprotein [Hordeum vulgare]|nr:gag-pol polyprotein [Hordeum vulgare]